MKQKGAPTEHATRTSSKALEIEIAKALKHKAKLEQNQLVPRYEIGRIAGRLETKYGTGAFAKLARRLGFSETLLRDHAMVARTFKSVAAFRKLTAGAVTWSHAVVLAYEDDDRRRAQLAKTVDQRQLSVRELKKHADETRTAAYTEPRADATSEPAPAARKARTQRQELTTPESKAVESLQYWIAELARLQREVFPAAQPQQHVGFVVLLDLLAEQVAQAKLSFAQQPPFLQLAPSTQ